MYRWKIIDFFFAQSWNIFNIVRKTIIYIIYWCNYNNPVPFEFWYKEKAPPTHHTKMFEPRKHKAVTQFTETRFWNLKNILKQIYLTSQIFLEPTVKYYEKKTASPPNGNVYANLLLVFTGRGGKRLHFVN